MYIYVAHSALEYMLVIIVVILVYDIISLLKNCLRAFIFIYPKVVPILIMNNLSPLE